MFFFKKSYVDTTDEVDIISIIHEVKYAIRDSKGPDGLLTVIVPQPGAGLVLIPAIDEVLGELRTTLEVFATETGSAKDRLKREREVGPIIQSAILGRSLNIPFQDGELTVDPYDEIFLVDFVKKSERREILIQVISEAAGQGAQGQQPQMPGPPMGG